jgi:SAM-dependent methyltransferase
VSEDAERFWDERAREQALFFVDNTVDYRHPDVERFWAGGEEALRSILSRLDLDIRPDEKVLEIGCGVGRMTRALAARAAHVTAIDISAEMLARARELSPGLDNVHWVRGDGESLAAVETASMDGCFSHVVFQHLPDPELTLGYVREMGRVLRPGGWAAFGLSTDAAVHRPRRRVAWRLAALVGRGPRGQEHPAWLGSAVPLERLRAGLAEAQLEPERVLGPGSQFTLVLARRAERPARSCRCSPAPGRPRTGRSGTRGCS